MPSKCGLSIKISEPVDNKWIPPPVPKGQSAAKVSLVRIYTKKLKN